MKMRRKDKGIGNDEHKIEENKSKRGNGRV
jgi:hypothetical protein